MKKILSILCILIILFSFVSCSFLESNIETTTATTEITEATETTETTEVMQPATTYYLGQTIESDIAKVTLNNAEFAYKLDSSIDTYRYISKRIDYPSIKYGTPREYKQSDAGTFYVARTGKTLIGIELKIENKDRTYLRWDGAYTVYFNNQKFEYYATYIYQRDGRFYFAENDQLTSVLIGANKSSIIRCYIEIPIDVVNLSADFYIDIPMKTSNGIVPTRFYSTNDARTNYHANLEEEYRSH